MSRKAEVLLEKIKALPVVEQKELWRELGRSLESEPEGAGPYGEPLTDQDIEDSARVTFTMLEQEEKRAGSR